MSDGTLHNVEALRCRPDVLVFGVMVRQVTAMPLTVHLLAELDDETVRRPFDLAVGAESLFPALAALREKPMVVVLGPDQENGRRAEYGGLCGVAADLVRCERELDARSGHAVFRRHMANARRADAECRVPATVEELARLAVYFTKPARITLGTLPEENLR